MVLDQNPDRVVTNPLLGPFRRVSQGPVLLEDVVAVRIGLAKPEDKVLLQEVDVDLCVDLEAARNENGWTLLAVGGNDPEDHDARRVLCFVDWGT